MMYRIVLALIVLSGPLLARDLRIGLPIDCAPGETCHIQNYVDRDPGPGMADFTCGALTYDGHTGTDFALPTYAEMQAGVDVLAVAPGTVLRVRDGMTDQVVRDPAEVADRECGNGIVIDHGDGWQTQYCHLMQGSIAVEPGRRVRMGQPIGQVGLSGMTEFPHVELVVRKDGQVVDPFDRANAQSCGGQAEPLWLESPGYEAGGFLTAGFAPEVPSFGDLKAGRPQPSLGRNLPLVAWGLLFGGRDGDRVQISITGPDGTRIHEDESLLDRTQAQLFRASGRRAPTGGWPSGIYRAELALRRGEEVIDRVVAEARIP